MHSSTAIKALMEGSYYDRIVAHMRFGDKAPLRDGDKQLFNRIEWVKEQWIQHKNDRLVVINTMNQFKVSQAQAYNYLADAKALFTLFVSFNTMAELLVMKERIDRAFILAESDPKSFSKLYASALEENRKWIELMREETERQRPDDVAEYIFIFHNDWHKIPGLTTEIMDDWNKEFDKLEEMSRSKFKHIDLADADYSVS